MREILEPAAKTLAESIPTVKACTKCGVKKLFVNFSPCKAGKFGKNSWCKQCHREARLSRYHGRADVKAREREYEKNYRKTYSQRIDVKIRTRKRKRLYARKRLKHDFALKMRQNLRNRIRMAIKKNLKSASTLKLIGCDMGFLRRWIEAKWKPGMTWDNYGFNGWHIDHIMPCASFDLSDPQQQRICFRWTNLQPLWAKENLAKSDRVE